MSAPRLILAFLAFAAVTAFLGFLLVRAGGEGGTALRTDLGPARMFALAPLEGEGNVALRDAVDEGPVLVNFWASWCAPCRIEHPLLMDLKAQGVRIIGVAYRDKPADAARFIARLGDPYHATALDPDGQTGVDWAITGVPESYIVGADGRILAHWAGPITPDGAADFLAIVAETFDTAELAVSVGSDRLIDQEVRR